MKFPLVTALSAYSIWPHNLALASALERAGWVVTGLVGGVLGALVVATWATVGFGEAALRMPVVLVTGIVVPVVIGTVVVSSTGRPSWLTGSACDGPQEAAASATITVARDTFLTPE